MAWYSVDLGNPCLGCTDRIGGCHGSCIRYAERCEQERKKKEAMKKAALVDDYVYKSVKQAREAGEMSERLRKRGFMK